MTTIVKYLGCAVGLLLFTGGCVRVPPETAAQREVVRQAKPPADACRELQRRLADQTGDAISRSDAEVEELLRSLAAQPDETSLRTCLITLMAKSPAGSQP